MASLLLLATACQPGLGPFTLDAAEGVVVDEDTGAPIVGAEVIEWHRGAGRGGSQPTYHARWATTDTAGAFAFPSGVAPSLRMWLLRTYDATYSFYHPEYGLEHAGTMPDEGSLAMRGSRSRAVQRRANLDPICRGEHDDPGSRRLAEIACTPRPERPVSESAP